MKRVRIYTALALLALLLSPLAAADKGKGKKGSQGVLGVPKSIELTAEQQEKVKAIEESYAPKLADWKSKYTALVSPERLAAQKEAIQKAKAEGKDKKEIKAAANAALNLTDEERGKLKDLYKDMSSLKKEARAKLLEILTDEQKEKLKSRKGGKGNQPAK